MSSNHYRAAPAVCAAVLALLSATGCMCADGLRRMPCAALQTDRAIARAEAAGACAAYTQSGQVRYLRGADAEDYRALRTRALEDGTATPPLDFGQGVTADQLRREMYPWWMRLIAGAGDVGVVAGVTYGGARLVDAASGDGGGEASYRDQRSNSATISGNNNNVVNNISQYGGPQSSGDAAPAE